MKGDTYHTPDPCVTKVVGKAVEFSAWNRVG